MTSTVILPWPDKRLSPNARIHWGEKARVTKKARQMAALFCRVDGLRKFTGCKGVKVSMMFTPPDKRLRDSDNAIAAFKAARDGIADYIGVDDADWRVSYHFAEPEKPGSVTITIEEDET